MGDKTTTYKLYGYRHFELTIFCFACMCNQITWISLQPVAGAIENAYGIGNTLIAFLGITYMIIFLFVNYPANYVIDKGGLRLSVSVSKNPVYRMSTLSDNSYETNSSAVGLLARRRFWVWD